MARHRPSRLRQKEWDPATARYADSGSPEWLDRVPDKFWNDPHNHVRYMRWLANKLGVKDPVDWYQVRAKDFAENHGVGFLCHYESPGAFVHAIKAFHPRFNWQEWFFQSAPVGFWNDRSNRLRYRDWLGKRLGFRKITDWYRLNQALLKANHGGGFLSHMGDSPQRIVKDFFPDEEWKPWLFNQTYKGFWSKKKNRLEYLRWLEEQLDINEPDDWYRVTIKDFARNNGGSLMQYNGNRGFENLLDDLYPGRKWDRWRFNQTTKGFWRKKKNRVEYLHWLGEQCGFRTFEDWTQLRSKHLLAHQGWQIYFAYYDGDVTRPVKELFPGRECHMWMFPKKRPGYWDQKSNRNEYVRWLGRKLGLRSNQDWYSLRPSHFQENFGRKLVSKHGPICQLVCDAFPKRKFYPWLFTRVPRGFWQSGANRNAYFDWLAKQLRIKSVAGWDEVQVADVVRFGASRLMSTTYCGKKAKFIRAAKRRMRDQLSR